MVLLRNICYEIVQCIFGMDISSVKHWWHCWVWGAYCATKQTIKKKNLIAHNLKIEKVSNKEIIQVKLLRRLFDCGLKTNFSFVEHSGFEENGWSVWEFIEYLWKNFCVFQRILHDDGVGGVGEGVMMFSPRFSRFLMKPRIAICVDINCAILFHCSRKHLARTAC